MDIQPDYHVVSLHYRLRTCDRVSYVNTPPVEYKQEMVHMRLENGQLVCELKTHFSTEGEARTAIEPILRAWELETDVRGCIGELRFEFVRAEIVDRNPPPPGPSHYVLVTGVESITVSGSANVSMHVAKNRYPSPPSTFHVTPNFESLWLRYRGYLEGREPLLAMGYFCFTFLKAIAGGNLKTMARHLGTDVDVLKKLSELTSTRGDRTTARKVKMLTMQPLSATEANWISAVLKELILRLGDTRPINSLKKITMPDFPNL